MKQFKATERLKRKRSLIFYTSTALIIVIAGGSILFALIFLARNMNAALGIGGEKQEALHFEIKKLLPLKGRMTEDQRKQLEQLAQ